MQVTNWRSKNTVQLEMAVFLDEGILETVTNISNNINANNSNIDSNTITGANSKVHASFATFFLSTYHNVTTKMPIGLVKNAPEGNNQTFIFTFAGTRSSLQLKEMLI